MSLGSGPNTIYGLTQILILVQIEKINLKILMILFNYHEIDIERVFQLDHKVYDFLIFEYLVFS